MNRSYSVYIPPQTQAVPPMVVCLHGTSHAPANQPPLFYCPSMGWERYSDRYGFLLVMPLSSWNPNNGGQWFWDAFGLDPNFPTPPDDSGFLRSIIGAVSAQYGTNPLRVFVTGMSSGGFMAHRVGVDSADLVAAIAPVSGMLWARSSAVPNASQPVSVVEYHGDKDTLIKYCGGVTGAWGPNVAIPSIDANINYWLVQDGLGTKSTALCTGSNPTANAFSLDFKGANGVEVEFIRELNTGHEYDTALTNAIWEFFAAHPKP